MRLTAALVLVALGACGSDAGSTDDAEGSVESVERTDPPDPEIAVEESAPDVVELHPDVIDATARLDGATWTFSATLSSPYDSPERYADAWRVIGPEGVVYAERLLTHDHAGEQPFTRSVSGVEIPEDVEIVTIQGRDQVSGWGGATFDVVLPRR